MARRRPLLHRCRAAAGLALLIAALTALGDDSAPPKRILILHLFGRDFSPFHAVASTFRTELARESTQPVAFYEASLDAGRPGPAENERPFIEFLRARFADRPPDLVVPVGGPTAQFYVRHRQRIFPDAPLLISGVDERVLQGVTLDATDGVVAAKLDLPRFIDNILQVLPATTTIAVIIGTSRLERYWLDEARKEFAPFAQRVNFVWLDDLSLDEMTRRVARLPPNSAVFYGILVVDGAGVPHEQEAALARLRAATNAPIFAPFEEQLGKGIVGGPLASQQQAGLATAAVARRLLHGEASAANHVVVGLDAPAYDWRELQRWNIDERRLPAGSVVHFRPASLWSEHKASIVAAITVVLLQAALITALLAQRKRRHRAEHEAIALSGRLLTAHEDERRRLARELHDDVTQRLARLAIDAARLERSDRATADPGQAAAIREELVHLSEDVHALSYRLHPAVLDDLGLVDALKAECDRLARREPIRVDIDARDVPRQLPGDVALCLFRVAQEALRNVARHAGASVVQVSIALQSGGLRLAVSDNGAGFDPARGRDRPSLGHASMRERVRLVGGELDIDTTPGHGTTIVAWIPLPRSSQ